MVYVTPARRGNPQPSSSDAPSGALHDHETQPEETFGDLKLTMSSKNSTALFADIHKHYWAPQSDDGDDSSSPPATLPIVLSHSTLNGSALHPEKLQYVMLFKDANPRWASDGIIFVKSSLHLLPGYEQAKDAGSSDTTRAQEETSTQHCVTGLEEQTTGMDSQVCDEKPKLSEAETVGDEVGPRKTESAKDEEKTTKDVEHQKQGDVGDYSTKPTGPLLSYREDDPDNPDATGAEGDGEVTSTATPASYSPDLSRYDTGPIAIFEQTTKRQDGHFRFEGYYKMTHLQYLPPQSAELYRMLEQKFSTMDRFGRWKQKIRSAASWNASMSLMWAVIKMEQDDAANARLGPPALTKSRAAER